MTATTPTDAELLAFDDDSQPGADEPTALAPVSKVPDLVDGIGGPPVGAFSRKAPQREYLVAQKREGGEVRGVIGRGQVHILAGEGGAGKGRWLLTIAAALAAGDRRREPDPEKDLDIGRDGGVDNVCGLDVRGIDDDEKVLVLLGEDDAIDVHQRFEGVAEALKWKDNKGREDRLNERFRWGTAHGTTFTIVTVGRDMLTGETKADVSGDFTKLTTWLKVNGPWAFIAMDPMARFAGVDENDNPLQTKVYGFVEGLTKVNGESKKPPAVLVVDHTGKPSKDKGTADITQHAIRGASAKVNAARVAMLMVPGGGDDVTVDSEGRVFGEAGFDESETAKVYAGDVTWHVVKNNGQRKAESVALSFTAHGGLHVEGEADTRARRKRQWHAANKRGTTTTKQTTKKTNGRAAADVDSGGFA